MSLLDARLQHLTRLYPRAIDLSLDRIRHLMGRLGNPQDRLPPIIHVAGTNGKGSTIATLRACLEAAGYRVHVYTSPHLVHFNERIRLSGRLIEDQALLDLLDEIERINDGTPITLFEITTAAAFLAFHRTPADIILLETGLGGKLDATNIILRPAVTVITPVSFDHMAYLGSTLDRIAGEKAGILKPGCPGVIGPQDPIAQGVIDARAEAIGAPCVIFDRDYRAAPERPGTWQHQFRGRTRTLPLSRLPGRHQIDNAAGAITAIDLLSGFTVSDDALAQGLENVFWPARLQQIRSGPLPDRLPPGTQIWLDGGHNASAGVMLAEHLTGWSDRPLYVLCGMLNNRAVEDFLRPMAPQIASLIGIAIPDEPNSHTAEAVAAAALSCGIDATPAPSLEAGLAQLSARIAQGPCRILICGSLYLAGSVLRHNA